MLFTFLQESQAVVDEKKLRKKCSTHVYISRLISVLKVTDTKDSLPLHEASAQGTMSGDKKLHMIKNGSTGVVFTNDIACSASEDSPSKLSNAILLHKKPCDDQQVSMNSGLCTTDKQVTFLFRLPLAFVFACCS